MGLEEVRKDILEEALHSVMALEKEAKATKEAIAAEATTLLAGKREAYEASLKLEMERMSGIILAEAESKAQHLVLEQKRALVDEALAAAKKALQKRNYAARLLVKAQKELDVKKVYCAKKDGASLRDVEIEDTDVGGGIVAENADGSISIDYSFPTLLAEIKEKQFQKIMGVLF